VVREPGCEVSAFDAWPSARYVVTVTFVRGATSNGIGSDTICAPTGTTTDDRPENVTGRDVPA
jgi:hypothetical protein